MRIASAVQGLGESPTVAINARSKALLAEGRSICRLGLGQSPFPVPTHVEAALAARAGEKDYLPTRGLPALRAAIAARARARGADAHAERVQVGPGTKELMFALQTVLDAELVLPRPSWVSYAPQARLVGRAARWLATDAERLLDPDDVDRQLARLPPRPRLLIVNSPGNPTGRAYDASRLAALAEVLRRHRVLALSDEIYSDTHFAAAHVSLARFYPEGTVVTDGLSKWCGAGGWRLGWLTLPSTLAAAADALAAVASETFTSVNAPTQYAAVEALADRPGMGPYLDACRAILGALAARVAARLAASGAAVPPPEGGFYVMPDFEALRGRLARRGITDGVGLCQRLLDEAGVAVLPGAAFGLEPRSLALRIAFVDFDGRAALRAVHAGADVEAVVSSVCAALLDGVERLCRFVDAAPRDH